MGYSDDPHNVRVDFFKPSGKWAYTEQVKFGQYFSPSSEYAPRSGGGQLIHDAFESSLRKHLTKEDGTLRHAGMWAICLEPYHEHAHPLMMIVPER